MRKIKLKGKTAPIITRDWFRNYINNNDTQRVINMVGRALVNLFNSQTNTEQNHAVTTEDNGVGFTAFDAKDGCIHAKYFLKHGTLEHWMVGKWIKSNSKNVPRIAKYHRQLNEIAVQKAADAYRKAKWGEV